MRITTTLLPILSILLTLQANGQEKKGDHELVQSQWRLERIFVEDFEASKFDRTAGVYEFSTKANIAMLPKRTYRVDTTKNPNEIVERVLSEGMTTYRRGIYVLDGDQLTICWARVGQPAPKQFGVKDGHFLILYERVK